jgi:hypothetical protein
MCVSLRDGDPIVSPLAHMRKVLNTELIQPHMEKAMMTGRTRLIATAMLAFLALAANRPAAAFGPDSDRRVLRGKWPLVGARHRGLSHASSRRHDGATQWSAGADPERGFGIALGIHPRTCGRPPIWSPSLQAFKLL